MTEDDPKLTAYLLGELRADEAADLEARLLAGDEDPVLLDDLRATAAILADALSAEPRATLSAQGTEALWFSPPPARRTAWWAAGIAAAACLALGAGIFSGSRSITQRGSSVVLLPARAPAAATEVLTAQSNQATHSNQASAGDDPAVSLVLFPPPADPPAPVTTLGSALVLLGIGTEHHAALLDERPFGHALTADPSRPEAPTERSIFNSTGSGQDRPLGKTPFSFDPS
jgi:hypothetical protein